jgi:uncharacterized protein YecE (DUF72 family)
MERSEVSMAPQPGMHVGCSGWVYRHWKGGFYPADLPQKRWFAHYSDAFDTVEINASFYRLPLASTFDGWREKAPPGFRYAVKANRFLTHMKKLIDCEAPLAEFIGLARRLGPALGPILYQLPPSLHKDLQRLDAFLSRLPRDHGRQISRALQRRSDGRVGNMVGRAARPTPLRLGVFQQRHRGRRDRGCAHAAAHGRGNGKRSGLTCRRSGAVCVHRAPRSHVNRYH